MKNRIKINEERRELAGIGDYTANFTLDLKRMSRFIRAIFRIVTKIRNVSHDHDVGM